MPVHVEADGSVVKTTMSWSSFPSAPFTPQSLFSRRLLPATGCVIFLRHKYHMIICVLQLVTGEFQPPVVREMEKKIYKKCPDARQGTGVGPESMQLSRRTGQTTALVTSHYCITAVQHGHTDSQATDCTCYGRPAAPSCLDFITTLPAHSRSLTMCPIRLPK